MSKSLTFSFSTASSPSKIPSSSRRKKLSKYSSRFPTSSKRNALSRSFIRNDFLHSPVSSSSFSSLPISIPSSFSHSFKDKEAPSFSFSLGKSTPSSSPLSFRIGSAPISFISHPLNVSVTEHILDISSSPRSSSNGDSSRFQNNFSPSSLNPESISSSLFSDSVDVPSSLSLQSSSTVENQSVSLSQFPSFIQKDSNFFQNYSFEERLDSFLQLCTPSHHLRT